MTIGPLGPPAEAKPGFELVASLASDLGVGELSMGMSDDIDVAPARGVDDVAGGASVVGPRHKGWAPLLLA